jgi:hypothetical protein
MNIGLLHGIHWLPDIIVHLPLQNQLMGVISRSEEFLEFLNTFSEICLPKGTSSQNGYYSWVLNKRHPHSHHVK